MYRILILLLISSFAMAQTGAVKLNQTDAKGRKQGAWKQYYPGDSMLRYEGQFENDIPKGKFIFYNVYGEKQVELLYRQDKVASAINYYPKGEVMARGKYVDKAKDSTWVYYDIYGNILSIENYIEGKKYGNWKVFTPEGKVLEEKYYENSLENGPYRRYYTSGVVYFEANYREGSFEDDAAYYHENGMLEMEGKYYRDAKEGVWKKYDEAGNLIEEITYFKGVPQTGDKGIVLEDTSKYYKKEKFTVDDVVEEDFTKIPTKEEEKKSRKEK